jgi:uncharacterized membrane protein YedE/YeeE
MSEAVLALVTGAVVGAVMARAGLCFNRSLRRAAFEHRPTLLRAFAIAVAAQMVLLPALVAAGVAPLERSAAAGGPPLLPAAQFAGGLVFGAGMALAGGCVTGTLWKAGAGATALVLAIAGFAAGELLLRGGGSAVINTLDDANRPRRGSLPELLGTGYEPLAVAVGTLALAALIARRRDGLAAGLALAAVAAVAWVGADLAGYGYGLGFVGAAQGTRAAIETGARLPFQLWLAIGVLAGGAMGGRRQLSLPDGPRAARAIAGGLLMGAGGSVAHGCNIGHGVTGIPLLSLGSLLATACMAAGALLTWRLLLAPHARLRGTDRIAAPADHADE